MHLKKRKKQAAVARKRITVSICFAFAPGRPKPMPDISDGVAGYLRSRLGAHYRFPPL
jgi:hypothetical protein